VLVVGRNGRTLLGLMLSSQSERDGQPNWLGLGPGDWDREARPSWVRLDRVLEVDQDGIRREGAILDRSRFDRVAAQLRRGYGWA
jgi:PemK-like, MazF-like toxin of type II toxin-antitoxin system